MTKEFKHRCYTEDMKDKATEQGKGVSPISGVAPPVASQFGQPNGNPRHNGAWKKEDTARYKLELLIQMSDDELDILIQEPTTPRFDKNMATAVKNGQWKELEGMINQVYGKPKETVDLSNPDGTLTPIVRIIDSRISQEE